MSETVVSVPVVVSSPSPTGTPVVKPSLVPVLVLIIVALNGALLALSQSAASPTVKAIAGFLVPLLSTLLGVMSPGARKAP